MKKILLLVFAVMLMADVSSQFKAGGGLTLGTKSGFDESGTKLGVGVSIRGDYAFNELWSVAPEFTLFFPGSPEGIDVSFWQFNANGHYKFHQVNDLGIYGLAGLNYSQVKVEYDYEYGNGFGFSGSSSDGELGLNLGGGVSCKQFFGELKYDTAFEQIAITAGVLFDL